MCWNRTGVRIPPLNNPARLFEVLFVQISKAERDLERKRLGHPGSVLDALREPAKSLHGDLNNADRDKLDQYLTSVREVERRLQMSEAWLDKPKPKPGINPIADEERMHIEEIPLFFDLLTLALQIGPKGQRFVSNFTRIWLELDNIGKMPPSKEFLTYYRDNLESAMRSETEHFFRHILDKNLPLREFLAAAYSFLNRELAEHYGMPGLKGNHFRKVSLPNASRGGILGHGSFLTASANGVDTSPVVRGIYVMNKLLDYTPPPPPEDVPAIEPDVRGATTLREQLIKHRADATCAQCHNKIDPPGFALENYDTIGGWRDQYERKLKVDASGKLPDGKTFASNAEFRKLVVAQDETFTRCLSRKLLTYAVGRKLNSSDRPSIDAIQREMKTTEAGLRDLIQAVVLSEIFSQN